MTVQMTVDGVRSITADPVEAAVDRMTKTGPSGQSESSDDVSNGAEEPDIDRDRSDVSGKVGTAQDDTDASLGVKPGTGAGDREGDATTAPPDACDRHNMPVGLTRCQSGIAGGMLCTDAHMRMSGMSVCMKHERHVDGGGQCNQAHTGRPIVLEMHVDMSEHAGNVPEQSVTAGTHAISMERLMQAMAEGISAGMVKALGSVGVLSIGHACMPRSENSMQQLAAVVKSESAHAHVFASEPQPATGCSADHGLHASRQAYGVSKQQYAASTGRQTHGGVPIRPSAVERCTEPQPAAEPQPTRSVPVNLACGALEWHCAASTFHASHGGVPVRQPPCDVAVGPQSAAAEPQPAGSASASLRSDGPVVSTTVGPMASSALTDPTGAARHSPTLPALSLKMS